MYGVVATSWRLMHDVENTQAERNKQRKLIQEVVNKLCSGTAFPPRQCSIWKIILCDTAPLEIVLSTRVARNLVAHARTLCFELFIKLERRPDPLIVLRICLLCAIEP